MIVFVKSWLKSSVTLPNLSPTTLAKSQAPLRIIFAGTPDFAAQHLAALIGTHHYIVGVYTQPDRPAGRGQKLTPSPVKQLALEHGIDVQQPPSIKSAESLAQLKNYNADIMVVVAYGLLLPSEVLNAPVYGCINVHGSLLPRWRGAAPIQRAILHGDTKTGVSIMQMDAGLDTGDVLATVSLSIDDHDTSASLYEKLSTLGQQALIDVLANIDNLSATPQNHEAANYAHKLSKADSAIHWNQPATAISQQVRGLNPWPVAYSLFNEQRVRIWMTQTHTHNDTSDKATTPGQVLAYSKQGMLVACADAPLLITQLQWPGGKVIEGPQLKNLQQKVPVGSILSSAAAS